jgi:hypothetical protein
MSMKHFAFPSALIVAAFLVGCGSAEDLGSAEQESHSWGSYHWARTSNPFTLKLGDNLTSNWDSYLSVASSDWTQSTVLNTTIVAGSVAPKTCKGTSGMVQFCNASYGGTGWLGIAGISISGGHIVSGYVKLNDTYYNTAQYNTPAWRALVTCQEVGHTFGLAHQDENFSNANLGTCMDYTNSPGTNQHPNSHDYNLLQTIYAHTDSTNTPSLLAGGAEPSQAGNSPAEWGEMVWANGGMSTYWRDFGDGNGLRTEVYWLPNGSAPAHDDVHVHTNE